MAFTHLTVNTDQRDEEDKKFEIHFEEFRSQLTILYVMVFEFILKFFSGDACTCIDISNPNALLQKKCSKSG